MVRPNGALRAGLDSSEGTGGTSCVVSFPVFKALIREANDVLRDGVGKLVALDALGPCPEELVLVAESEVLGLVWPNDDDSEANESPRA